MIKEISKTFIETTLAKLKLKEAGLSQANVDQGFKLIANQLRKRLGCKVYILPFKQEYISSYGRYSSIVLVLDWGGNNIKELRFNLLAGRNKSNDIVSIDFFTNSSNTNKPVFTLKLNGYNILKTLDMIIDAVKNPVNFVKSMQESINEKIENKLEDFTSWVKSEFIKDDYLVNTKKLTLYSHFYKFAKTNSKVTPSLPTFNLILKEYLLSKGLVQKYDRVRIVKAATSEKRIISNELKELINFVDDNMNTNDIEDDLETLKADIKMVAGNINSNGKSVLVVFGDAGIGKSETVYSTVKQLGVPYAYTRITVKSQADFYKLLYVNNSKLIIIDDSNEILKKGSKFAMQLLALGDTSLVNRRLSYVDVKDKDIKSETNPNGKIPQSFTFSGGLVFLTNAPLTKLDNALISRAIMCKVEASNEGIISSIKSKLTQFYPEVDLKIKEQAIDFIEQLTNANMIKKLDFRVYSEVLNYFSIPDMPIDRAKTIIIMKIKKGLLNMIK